MSISTETQNQFIAAPGNGTFFTLSDLADLVTAARAAGVPDTAVLSPGSEQTPRLTFTYPSS